MSGVPAFWNRSPVFEDRSIKGEELASQTGNPLRYQGPRECNHAFIDVVWNVFVNMCFLLFTPARLHEQ